MLQRRGCDRHPGAEPIENRRTVSAIELSPPRRGAGRAGCLLVVQRRRRGLWRRDPGLIACQDDAPVYDGSAARRTTPLGGTSANGGEKTRHDPGGATHYYAGLKVSTVPSCGGRFKSRKDGQDQFLSGTRQKLHSGRPRSWRDPERAESVTEIIALGVSEIWAVDAADSAASGRRHGQGGTGRERGGRARSCDRAHLFLASR